MSNKELRRLLAIMNYRESKVGIGANKVGSPEKKIEVFRARPWDAATAHCVTALTWPFSGRRKWADPKKHGDGSLEKARAETGLTSWKELS